MNYKKIAVIIIIIWGTSASLVKEMILQSNNNYWMVIISYNLLASIILISAAFVKGEHKIVRYHMNKVDFYVLLLCNGFYDVLMALAITFAISVHYAIIGNYLWPIFLSLLIPITRKIKLQKNSIFGGILGFLSVIIIFYPSITSGIQSNYAGIFFAVLAAFLWAFYSAKLNQTHLEIAILIQGLAQLISGLAAVFFAIYWGQFRISDILNLGSFFSIIIYSVFNMSLAYVLWIITIIKHPDIQKFTVKVYLLPILSLLISSFWFKEDINFYVLPAAILLLLGIAFSENHIEKIFIKIKNNF